MKKILLFAALTSFLLACGENSSKQENSKNEKKTENSINQGELDTKMKRYDVKSGIIEYKISTEGSVMGFKISGEGTKKVIFKDWGAVELVEERKTEDNMGQKSETHNLNKFDNGYTYTVNFEQKKIYKGNQKGMFNTFITTHENMAEAGKSMLESMGGKKVGEEKIQSYECKIWEIMGQKVWLYKGLSLRVEVDVMGIKTIEEATQINLNCPVRSEDLKLPNFEIIDTEEMQTPTMDKDEKENINEIRKMSFEDFKKKAKETEDMKNMTDKELKQTFEMMKKMASMMPQ